MIRPIGGMSMLPVVLALQTVVVVQVLEAAALILGTIYLVRRLRAAEAEARRRDVAQARMMAVALSNLEVVVRAARADSATYLQAVFTGVQGLARNLDAARESSAQTLEELKRRAQAATEPPPADPVAEPVTKTLDDVRPVEVVRLRETRSRRKSR
jgi:Tfp pilus assembly protein PilV